MRIILKIKIRYGRGYPDSSQEAGRRVGQSARGMGRAALSDQPKLPEGVLSPAQAMKKGAQAEAARAHTLRTLRSMPEVSEDAAWWIEKAGPSHYASHLPRLREWVEELRSGALPAGDHV